MAAPPARARADYDYLIKLLLIGDSGESLPVPPSIRARSGAPLDLSPRLGSGALDQSVCGDGCVKFEPVDRI
jgi:hypothetical protein